MRIYELKPTDSRKSFCGKARVIEKDNGETVLQSYETEVCKIKSNGEFVRLWSGYSATTMRHVNSFVRLFNIAGGGKAWWDAQTLEEKLHKNDLTPEQSLKIMYARRNAKAI